MDTTKNRNSKDLTEAEELKKRWQEYTEEVYQKISYDLNNLDGRPDLPSHNKQLENQTKHMKHLFRQWTTGSTVSPKERKQMKLGW